MDAVVKPGADEDMANGMQCTDHPFRTNPSGICAFCLQEKLGKLVSSSLPLPIRPSSSSSPPSPPSFRSDVVPVASSSSASRPSASALPTSSSSSSSSAKTNYYYTRRPRFPSLLTKKKHKKKASANASSSAPPTSDVFFKRSKSTATPRRGKFLDDPEEDMVMEDFCPRKRHGFWSFLHLSSKSSVSAKKLDGKSFRDGNNSPRASMINNGKQKEKCMGSSLGKKSDIVIVEEDDAVSASASASSFERKVSRSRSVGCGSRSFSGDFFERISTGFGDCALRRVESQREGKPKVAARGCGDNHHHSMKERVRCAGLFSGFMMNSSSSSSSSSSYLVSSSTDDHHNHHHNNNSNNNKNTKSSNMALSHDRAGRNWSWAFASPMRAFSSKPSNSKDVKNTATPNLSAVPSLLAVRG